MWSFLFILIAVLTGIFAYLGMPEVCLGLLILYVILRIVVWLRYKKAVKNLKDAEKKALDAEKNKW